MSDILPVQIDGDIIYVEVDERYGSEETSSATKALEGAENAFERARKMVTNIAKSMIGAIRTLDEAVTPDTFELEFSIKFSAEGQVILAKSGVEASLRVQMTYNHKKD